MSTALKMAHARDPREDIHDKLGKRIANIKVMGARVLVGTYVRPEKTAGGIILTDKSRDEDKYQGKVGLVLKMGPLAFTEDDTHKFPDKPKVGDWVLFRVGDTWPLLIGDQDCRFVDDVAVQSIVPGPDMVY